MNKAELIEKVSSSYQKLDAALAKIDLQQMDISNSTEQWTVKETLVHITAWEQTLLTDFVHLTNGEPVHELGSQEEIDACNAATRSRAQVMPLQQAMSEFQSTYKQIINWLEKLPDDELNRPFAYGMSLGEFIGEDTWKHYDEHLENIKAHLI